MTIYSLGIFKTYILLSYCSLFCIKKQHYQFYRDILEGLQIIATEEINGKLWIKVTLPQYCPISEDIFLPFTTCEKFIESSVSGYLYNLFGQVCEVVVTYNNMTPYKS